MRRIRRYIEEAPWDERIIQGVKQTDRILLFFVILAGLYFILPCIRAIMEVQP